MYIQIYTVMRECIDFLTVYISSFIHHIYSLIGYYMYAKMHPFCHGFNISSFTVHIDSIFSLCWNVPILPWFTSHLLLFTSNSVYTCMRECTHFRHISSLTL